MSHVKITAPGPTGVGTVVEVDGVKQNLVTSIEVNIGLDCPSELIIHQWVPMLSLSGEFQVDKIFSYPDLPDKKYRLVEVTDGK